MAAASFSHRARVHASPQVVWDRLQQPDAWAQIGPIDEVWDAEVSPSAGLTTFRWSTRAAGRRYEGTASTSHAVPGKLMVVDLITSEVQGSVTVTIEDAAIEVDMSLRPVGLLASVFFSVVADAVGGGLAGHVDQFAAQFE
jgi:hypothetical protein